MGSPGDEVKFFLRRYRLARREAVSADYADVRRLVRVIVGTHGTGVPPSRQRVSSPSAARLVGHRAESGSSRGEDDPFSARGLVHRKTVTPRPARYLHRST